LSPTLAAIETAGNIVSDKKVKLTKYVLSCCLQLYYCYFPLPSLSHTQHYCLVYPIVSGKKRRNGVSALGPRWRIINPPPRRMLPKQHPWLLPTRRLPKRRLPRRARPSRLLHQKRPRQSKLYFVLPSHYYLSIYYLSNYMQYCIHVYSIS
jgi:hypothetical protein